MREPIYHYNPNTPSSWDQVDGGAIAIAVGPDGQPWIVNKQGTIFRRTKTNTGYVDGTWQVVPGQAGDIAIGATAPSGRLEYPGRTVAVT